VKRLSVSGSRSVFSALPAKTGIPLYLWNGRHPPADCPLCRQTSLGKNQERDGYQCLPLPLLQKSGQPFARRRIHHAQTSPPLFAAGGLVLFCVIRTVGSCPCNPYVNDSASLLLLFFCSFDSLVHVLGANPRPQSPTHPCKQRSQQSKDDDSFHFR
jgi:hypothetical protein